MYFYFGTMHYHKKQRVGQLRRWGCLWGVFCVALLLSGCLLKPQVIQKDGLKAANAATRAKAHASLAAGYIEINRYDIANDEAKIAMQIDPSSGAANNISGMIALKLEKYDEAKRYFRQALVSEPKNPNFQNNIALVLCKTGSISEGLDFLNMALANKLYTSPQNSLMNAGFCTMLRKDWHQAETYYQQARMFNQTALKAMEQLTIIYLKTGRADKARSTINEVTLSAGTPTDTQLKLGVIAARASGHLDEAKSIRKRLYADYPNLINIRLPNFKTERFDIDK